MVTHEDSAGIAPAMTAVAVIAAVAGSLWWNTREEPPAMAPAAAMAPSEAVAPVVAAPVAAVHAPAKAVMAFAGFANGEPPQELPLDHGYAAEGLRQLAAALAEQGGNLLWRDRALRLEEAAATLERDAASLDHANAIRKAFVQAGEWIAGLRGDHARTQAVADAARKIDGGQALQLQRAEVMGFFRAAAAALQGSRSGAPENRA